MAWQQNNAALAEDLEREAGRMEFAIEVRKGIARARAQYHRRMREEESAILLAGELISIESAWAHVAKWVESDAEAATVWVQPQELPYVYTFQGDAAGRWAIHFREVNFIENLKAWLDAVKNRIDCQVNLLKKQRDIVQETISPDDPREMYACFCLEEAIASWHRVIEVRTVGDTDEASSLESRAKTWMRAAESPAAEEIWFPLRQAVEEHDKGRADIALAWEYAANAYLAGKVRIAQAWKSAALELEEAWAEEDTTESPA